MCESPETIAAHLINIGVAYYEDGQYEEAIVAFTEALTSSKKVLLFENANDCSDTIESLASPFQPYFGKSEKILSGASDLFIFLNPIKVLNKLPTTKRYKTLSLITMFNLAICHHRSAIKNSMDKTALRKALQLYELAYAIQMQEGIDMTLTPTMIIMSNVGHIHKILGNDENANQCFQHLLSTLMFLVEAGEKDMVWEFDGFFANIMSTIFAHSPAAAA